MISRRLIGLLILFPFFAVAQVGVGTTNVHASAKLQIESANKGFLQPRVALTGTNDNSTISSPATGLMVFNTADAGSGTTAVTQGVYYYTGTAWTRLSDAQSTTFVSGTLGVGATGGSFVDIWDGPPFYNLGEITLPPGKWEVIMNIENLLDQKPGGFNNIALQWLMTYWLSDQGVAPSPTGWRVPQTLSNLTSDLIAGGSGSFTETMSELAVMHHKGSFLINNAGSIPKTYILNAVESNPVLSMPTDPGHSSYFRNLGGTSWAQNRLYAVKIN